MSRCGYIGSAMGFNVYHAPLDSVRHLVETGQVAVLGEVMNQFVGVAPGDALFQPYLALAEAHNILLESTPALVGRNRPPPLEMRQSKEFVVTT